MKRAYILIFLSVLAFLVGLYYYTTMPLRCLGEGFVGAKKNNNENLDSCPDLLVRKGNVLLLYNSNVPAKDGENPLPFYNLDEYINYLEIQRNKGKICPVLFLQFESDAQGNDIYRIRKSPFEMQGGLPANVDPALFVSNFDPATQQKTIDGQVINIIDSNRSSSQYNTNMYAGFDPYGLHVGEYTNLDLIHDSTETGAAISDNPMDPNWGGVRVSEQSVASGKYEDRYVSRPMHITPKTNYLPGAGPLPPTEVPDFLKPRPE